MVYNTKIVLQLEGKTVLRSSGGIVLRCRARRVPPENGAVHGAVPGTVTVTTVRLVSSTVTSKAPMVGGSAAQATMTNELSPRRLPPSAVSPND